MARKRKRTKEEVRLAVQAKTNGRCWYCGQIDKERSMHIDHVKAFSRGGSDDINNLVWACRECNMGKRAHSLKWFRKNFKHKQFGGWWWAPYALRDMREWHWHSQGEVELESIFFLEVLLAYAKQSRTVFYGEVCNLEPANNYVI